MLEIKEKQFIKLKEDTFFFPSAEGIYFRNSIGYFTIKGRNIYPFFSEISKYLNGKYTLKDIVSELSKTQEEKFLKLIAILEKNGFVKYTERVIDENYYKNYEKEIAFIDYYTNNGIELFKKLSNFKICLYGSNKLSNTIQKSLENIGIQNIKRGSRFDFEGDIVIYCNNDVNERENLLECMDFSQNKIFIFVGNKESLGIISPIIKNLDDWKEFENILEIGADNIKENTTFTSNSILSSMLSFEIIKYVTNCLQSDLINAAYILNTDTLKGNFVQVKKKIDLKQDFIETFKQSSGGNGLYINKIGRGSRKQIPLSQWEVELDKLGDMNSEKIKVVSFGDTHQEARFNTYYKTIEHLIINGEFNLEESYSFKNLDTITLAIDEQFKRKLTISCDIDKELAIRKAILKAILKREINVIDNYQELSPLKISDYIDNKNIQYYCKLINILKAKIELRFKKLVEGLFLVVVSDNSYRGVSIGFNLNTALENALRQFINNLQNSIYTINIEDVIFKRINDWDDECIREFLTDEKLEVFICSIQNNVISAEISIVGAILIVKFR
ncbi:hypothetical protein [Bacillus cereus]|uniref:hypothetical protein n=1 Tax=Bacillus cereus TaxID=1396 RepID=UPI003F5314BB